VTGLSEQFSEPEVNVIESTEGFSIRVLGRTGLRYTEGARSVWIENMKRAFDARGYELQINEAFDWSTVALRPPTGND
jgi:hypothetical protein